MSIKDRLWTADAKTVLYRNEPLAYQTAVLEQYLIYVEMADRISQRRGYTNTFFLTLNTLIFTTVSMFWKYRADGDNWWLFFPLCVLLAQCFSWYYLLRSYRQLNAAKYEIVGALEEQLPASPYYRAEWFALGEGVNRSKYWPLSHIEGWIPVFFGFLYLVGFIFLISI